MMEAQGPNGARDWRDGLPARAGIAIWSNLPLLLLMDAVLFVATMPAVAAFFLGGHLWSPLLVALVVGPVWAATTACAGRMARDEVVTPREFVGAIGRHAKSGILVSAVPAAVATAALGTLSIMEKLPGERWLLLPLVVDGSVLVLAVVAGFSAFSLATAGGLGGWALWRASLGLAAARPLVTLGTVALLVLLGYLVGVAPGILPVLPAPFAVYLSVATWDTMDRLRERTGDEDGEPGGLR